jgi:hypothetical protein
MGDVTARKHHGNRASEAAHAKGSHQHASLREQIFEMIAHADGLTSKELGHRLGRPIHTFSGRLSQLKAEGRIVGTGEMREGAEVLVRVGAPKQRALFPQEAA